MRRTLYATILIAIAISINIDAQQFTKCVNVMPVWMPCDCAADPNCANHARWADAWRYREANIPEVPARAQIEETAK